MGVVNYLDIPKFLRFQGTQIAKLTIGDKRENWILLKWRSPQQSIQRYHKLWHLYVFFLPSSLDSGRVSRRRLHKSKEKHEAIRSSWVVILTVTVRFYQTEDEDDDLSGPLLHSGVVKLSPWLLSTLKVFMDGWWTCAVKVLVSLSCLKYLCNKEPFDLAL